MSESQLQYTTTAEDRGAGALFDSLSEKLTGVGQIAGGLALGGVAALGAGLVGAGAAITSFAGASNQSINDLEASLGLTRTEAEALGDVGVAVFKDNWYGSIQEATAAVGTMQQTLGRVGDISESELHRAAAGAAALQDTFGVEVPQAADAAATLMQNFGLSSQEAFDFITKGFQSGLDRSGDFLDTIGEYSVQFASGGADAAGFFSIIDSGLQGGMLGTDKAADAFKEFRVRIQDGSTLTSDSLRMLGIDATKLGADMASGQVTAADAFELVQTKLRGVKDENVLMQAGVGLLGTQFEDLGTDAALALSLTGTKLEDLAGATDSLNAKYNNFGSLWEGFKRQTLVALEPIGAKILELANSTMPTLEAGMAWVGTQLPVWIDAGTQALGTLVSGWQQLQPVLAPVIGTVAELALHLGALLSGNGFEDTIPSILEGLGQIGVIAESAFTPLITAAGQWVLDALPILLTNIASYQGQLMGATSDALPGFLETLLGYGVGIQQWVLDALPGVLTNLGTFAQTLISQAMAHVPGWIAALAQFSLAAVEWVVAALPGLVANLTTFGSEMLSWAVGQLPGWGAQLAQLGAKIGGWVLDALPGLAANLGQAAGVLLGWVIATTAELVPQLLALAGKFIGWVATDVLPALPGALATIAGALWTFVSALVQEAGPQLLALAGKFVSWVGETVVPALPGALEAIKTTISGWISGALGWAGEALHGVGQSIIQSLIGGFESMFGAVRGKLGELTNMLPDWKGPASRDAVLLYKSGQLVIGGFNDGLADSIPTIERTLTGLTDSIGKSTVPADVGSRISAGMAQGVKKGATKLDTALVETLADTVSKAADAVTKGAAAFGLLDTFVAPAREGITAFANAARDLVADFATAARDLGKQLNQRTTLFADTAAKSVGLLGQALTAFEGLADFTGVPEQAIEDLGVAIADTLVELTFLAGEFADQGLDKTALFAQSAETIVKLIGAALGAFTNLALFEAVPQQAIEDLGIAIADALVELTFLAGEFADQGLEATAVFAGHASTIVKLVGDAVGAFGGMEAYEGTAPERMAALGRDIDLATALLLEIAQQADSEGVATAALFASAMRDVFGLFGDAISVFIDLQDFKGVAAASMEALAAGIHLAIWWMGEIARGSAADGLQAAAELSLSAGSIFTTIAAAVDALGGLREYEGVPAERFQQFAADFVLATLTLQQLVTQTATTLQAAEAWQAQMGAIAGAITAGTSALANLSGISELPALDGIPAAVEEVLAGPDGIQRLFYTAWETIQAQAELGLDWLKSMVVDTKLLEIVGLIRAHVETMSRAASAVGAAIADGMIAGINAGSGAIAAAATQAAEQALSAAKSSLGIQSPSRVFADEVGAQITAGIAQGILEHADDVSDALNQLFDAGSVIGSLGSTVAGRIKDQQLTPLKDSLDGITSEVDRVTSEIVDINKLIGVNPDNDAALQQRLLNLEAQRTALLGKQTDARKAYEATAARIAAFEQQQANLQFLQQQVKLLDLISAHGLDAATVLDGLQLGVNADPDALLAAMTRALEGIVGQVGSQIPAFANGTNNAPGSPLALVGELGPELVHLPRGSRVETASETRELLGGAGGGVTINQYFTIGGGTSDSDMRRMMQIAREEAQKVLREAGARGDVNQRMRGR